jgi:hypothetical protein
MTSFLLRAALEDINHTSMYKDGTTDVESFQAALKEYQPTADILPLELRRQGLGKTRSLLSFAWTTSHHVYGIIIVLEVYSNSKASLDPAEPACGTLLRQASGKK